MTINLLIYFWTFYFALLIFVFIFMLKLQSLNCCSTVLAFKIGKCEFSNFFVPTSSKNYSFIDCISINWVYLYFNNREEKKSDKQKFTYTLICKPVCCHFFFCSEFCDTLEWNSHEFTCVPHPDPASNLPLHPLPLGFPSAPGPITCLMHLTWAGDLFHPRYYTSFDPVLLKHPTLSFSHRV